MTHLTRRPANEGHVQVNKRRATLNKDETCASTFLETRSAFNEALCMFINTTA